MNLTCGVCIFFFFQAEDGIRDIGVTGVQTCALPISLFWTPLRVCLLFTTTVLAVAWLKQAPCADGDWTGSLQYTHLCYSDPVPLFGVYGQGEGALPYPRSEEHKSELQSRQYLVCRLLFEKK